MKTPISSALSPARPALVLLFVFGVGLHQARHTDVSVSPNPWMPSAVLAVSKWAEVLTLLKHVKPRIYATITFAVLAIARALLSSNRARGYQR